MAGEAGRSQVVPPGDRVLLTDEAPVVHPRSRAPNGVSAPLPAPLAATTRSSRRSRAASASRSSPTARSTARTSACTSTRVGDGLAVFVARPLTEVDRALGTLRWALGRARAGGDRARGPPLAARDAHRDPAGRRAHRRPPSTSPSTRDLSRRIEAARRRRGLAPGDLVQHDARGARALPARAAPARRRRLARAAHAAHLAAHQPRGARARRPAGRRATASGCAPTSWPQLEELTALVGDLVELARDDEPEPPATEDVRLDRLVAAAVERARRHAPPSRFATELEPALVAGRPGAAGPRRREPARQRRQVQPARRRRRRARCATAS